MKFYNSDLYPLKFLLLYVIAGVLLSTYGPIQYSNYNQLIVVVYIFFFLVLFSIGYFIGIGSCAEPVRPLNTEIACRRIHKILFWIRICIVINALIQLAILLLSLSNESINLSIFKLGEAYVNVYSDYQRGSGNVSGIFLVKTITYIPYIVTLILGSYYFKELPKTFKILVVFSYLSTILLETIGYGKQKQIGDMLIILVSIVLLRSSLHIKRERKKIFRTVLTLGLIGVISLVVILQFRYSALGINESNINVKVHKLMHYNTNHLLFDMFGKDLGFVVSVFTGYLSQGYYGLSLNMQQSFEWTYFVGNSYSLSVFLNRYLGIPVDFHDTYPYRTAIQTGWDDSKWSTIFPWFAGDFTFIGTLFVFALVAVLYAKVWREAYKYQNPISIVLFVMLTIGIVYIPANNQLLHSPGSFMAFVFFVLLWLFKHKKYNM